jgi:Transposase DDE domain
MLYILQSSGSRFEKDTGMAAPKKPRLTEQELQGFKYFRLLGPLFTHLRLVGTERDSAGNRQLFYDQYATLLLVYFFSPTVTSLRGLQQATTLAKVQQRLGVRRTSLGALSEAATVFDAALLHEVIGELGAQLRPHVPLADQEALRHLTAIDGSLLPALPQMAWALWQDAQHRAAKMHVAFEVLRQVPVDVTVTAGNAAERTELRRLVYPGGFYVFDRGYADYTLFQELHELPCSFVGRVQNTAVYEVQEERPISAVAQAAGVRRDCTLRRLGTPHHTRLLPQPFRIVLVATGKSHADGTPEVLVLVTNRLDLAAELVALAYRFRWAVELFFRWLKCVLGCRHLLSQSENGVSIQVYVAIIASLLISLWVGRAPTKRTYEMLCFYLSGWASEEELVAHIAQLHLKAPPPCKS